MAKKQKSKESRRGRSGRGKRGEGSKIIPIAGRHFSSGGVVFKKDTGEALWLVTKSSTSKEFPKAVWRLPKGFVDDEGEGFSPGPMARGEIKATEEALKEAAKREVEEEGGVKAKIVSKLGTVKYFITVAEKKYLKFVTFFLMEWQKDLPDGFGYETSKTAWLPFSQAREKLTYDGERRVLDKAKEVFDQEV